MYVLFYFIFQNFSLNGEEMTRKLPYHVSAKMAKTATMTFAVCSQLLWYHDSNVSNTSNTMGRYSIQIKHGKTAVLGDAMKGTWASN
jgi:hypothetical protein